MSLEVCSERNLFRVVVFNGLAAGKLKHMHPRVSLHLLILKMCAFRGKKNHPQKSILLKILLKPLKVSEVIVSNIQD